MPRPDRHWQGELGTVGMKRAQTRFAFEFVAQCYIARYCYTPDRHQDFQQPLDDLGPSIRLGDPEFGPAGKARPAQLGFTGRRHDWPFCGGKVEPP